MSKLYDDKWDDPRYVAAIERNKRANAATGRRNRWIARDERAQEVIDFLDAYTYETGFLGKMSQVVNEWGELTEKQYAAVIKIIDDRNPRRRKEKRVRSNRR